MAYDEFTLESVTRLLGVSLRAVDLFRDVRAVTPPTWLAEALERGAQRGQLSLISEKSRSEFVVAPVLLAGRQLSGDRFAIYSGHRFDVDPARGLVGECDFILTASEPVLPLQLPCAVVVEAKKNDIEAALGQCVAQMVAADQFNQAAGRSGTPIFGCATSGEVWQFLRLKGTEALLDRQRFYISNVGIILGVIRAIAADAAKLPGQDSNLEKQDQNLL